MRKLIVSTFASLDVMSTYEHCALISSETKTRWADMK